jgi:hypothetical protein
MIVDKAAPTAVAHLGRARGRVDDVGVNEAKDEWMGSPLGLLKISQPR